MPYELVFSDRFDRDMAHWLDTNSKFAKKIHELLASVQVDPRDGLGKPERLKYFFPYEVWSRRIAKEHRLVYRIEKDWVYLMQARFHYKR